MAKSKQLATPFYLGRTDKVIADIVRNEAFTSMFPTDEDKEKFANYRLNSALKEKIGESPYLETEPFKADFNPEAKKVKINEDDSPDVKAFKEMNNRLVRFGGKLPEPDFLRRTFGSSMTNDWLKLLSGKDYSDTFGSFSMAEDGIRYKGEKLNLNAEQNDLISKYILRNTGQEHEKDFIDNVAETFVSLTWDLPLLMLTGAASSGAMKATALTRNLVKSSSVFQRTMGQVLQQSVNFNLLGLPQTVDSIQNISIGAGLESIYHSIQMGTLAAITGGMGAGVAKTSPVKAILKKNPALREELGSVGGSLGFGYLSGKFAGLEDEDAIAQALAFAATHVTNPRAFSRVLTEMKNSKIRVELPTDKTGIFKDKPKYFIEKNGKLKRIDEKVFQKEGTIVELENAEIIEMSKENADNYKSITEVENESYKTFTDLLSEEKNKKVSKKILEDWTKQLPEDYVKKNRMELSTMADFVATATTATKWTDAFKRWEVPDISELNNKVVEVANNIKMPVRDVRDFIASSIPEYLANPDVFSKYIANPDAFPEYKKNPEAYINRLDKFIGERSQNEPRRNEIMQELADLVIAHGDEVAKNFPVKVKAKAEEVEKITESGQREEYKTTEPFFLNEKDFIKKNFTDLNDAGKNLKQLSELKNRYKTYLEKVIASRASSLAAESIKMTQEEKTPSRKPQKPESGSTKEIQKSEKEKIPKLEPDITEMEVKDIPFEKLEGERKRVDKELERLIPDPGERALNKTIVNERDQLSKEAQKMLERYDAVAERIHNERSKDLMEYDISDIPTPENRRKTLLKKPPVKEPTTEELANLVQKASNFESIIQEKGNEISVEELSKSFPFDAKPYDFLWKALDQLGVKFGIKKLSTVAADYVDLPGKPKISISRDFLFGKDLGRYNKLGKTYDEIMRETFVHEAVHAITFSDKLVGGSAEEFYRENISPLLKDVGKEIKTQIEADLKVFRETGKTNKDIDQYVMDDIYYMLDKSKDNDLSLPEYTELLSVSFSNPGVAKYLDAIPATESLQKKGIKSIWNTFKETIRKYFQNWIGVPESILDQITQSIDNLYTKKGFTKLETSEFIEKGQKSTEIKPDISQKSSSEGGRELRKPNTLSTNINYSPSNRDALKRLYGTRFAQKREELDRALPSGRKDKTIFESRLKVDPPAPQKILEDYQRLHSDALLKDIDRVRKSGLEFNEKTFREAIKNNKIVSLQNYLDLNLPPIFRAEMSKRFRDKAYLPGESMIRMVPYQTNRILQKLDGWNGGSTWRKLAGIKSYKLSEQTANPEGQQILDAIKAYEYGRYTGQIPNDFTWGQFADWANLNTAQRKVLDAMKIAEREAIEAMKEMKIKFIVDFDNNIFNQLPDSELKIIMRDRDIQETITGLKEKVKTDKDLKRQLAEYIVEGKFKSWGEKFHYNGIRPSDPETVLVSAEHTTNKVGENPERMFTYFNNWKEANQAIENLKANGFKITESYQIKDLIGKNEYWNKLTAHQILELANAGHIDFNNEVIDKLLEATKSGVDLNTLKKEYIPGMKYSAEEFERQLERFVRTAVSGSYRSYYLTEIDRNLTDWKANLNQLTIESKGRYKPELQRARAEYEYAQRYLNQLKQPERTVIDGLRGATISMQVGLLKPAFLFQQASQIFQTVLPQTISEVKASGLSVGQGIRMFNEAAVESVKAALAVRATKHGVDITKAREYKSVDPELVDILHKLELMNKVGGTGLSELTADVAEVDYTYKNKSSKVLEAAKRAMTYLGKGVEKWTRTQSAITFYKLGKVKGLEGNDLLNYIADGIDKTMSEWGKGGRAPLLDSKKAKPGKSPLINAMKKSFMTYKTFSFYNYGMWRNMIHNKQFAPLAAKFMVGAGMHGLTKFPLFASMLYIADLFTDDDLDYEMWEASDWLDENIPGEFAGGLLHRGIGSFFNVDLRETFGEDTPLISDLWAESWAKSWESKVLDITLGAPLGFSKDYISGLSTSVDQIWRSIDENTFSTDKEKKRAKKIIYGLLPVSVRNIAYAMDWEKDGIEARGKTMVFRDDLSSLDVALKMLSFPVEKQTRAYAKADGGIEAQYNKYNEILRRGSQHRKDLVAQGLPPEIIKREMERVVQDMKEARIKLAELRPEVMKLRRQRKIQNLEKEN